MHALLAGWRVSLRRTRADWPIVAAAWLITLLAATLVAGGVIYPSAAAEAGLRRALAEAPEPETNVEVLRYGTIGDAMAADELVQAELRQVLGPVAGEIVRAWRTSTSLALPETVTGGQGEGGSQPDQATLGYLDGLPEHATLVAGSWPATSGAGDPGAPSAGPIDVVMVDAAATALGLEVGQEFTLVAHPSSNPLAVPVRIVGIFAVNDATDGYWNEDVQLITGITDNGQYQSFGPFFGSVGDLLRHDIGSITQRWHAFVGFDGMAIDQAGPIRGRIGALSDRLEAVGGEGYQVATGLPALLEGVERSLLVSRTGVLLLIAQLAVLAAYAIVLTAALLVDHRRVDTAMLRSRGASPWQVAWLALLEGLLLAIPAVIAAPWLAVGALNVLNDAGPLADVGLRIAPRVGDDAYIAAAIAGIGCVALLVLPAFLAARGFAAEQGGKSRQETRTIGQRLGIDVALLALTGIALWQLRLYGAPLTRTVQGSLGIDPLLVAAPAIGMVAGAVLALRMLPMLAQLIERGVARGRNLVLSMGSRQLSRRPLQYTRSALLLMLAMSMGVFALSYGATWSNSQRDQAAYQVGADVRVRPLRTADGPPLSALPAAYAALAGVQVASPVERLQEGITFLSSGSADILALDADAVPRIVNFRTDESSTTLEGLSAALRGGRPGPALATLPADAGHLQIAARVDVESIQRFVLDEETGEFTTEPLDPSELVGVRVGASATIRDANGLLYQVASPLVPMDGSVAVVEMPLTPANAAGAGFHGPAELAGLGIEVWLPNDTLLLDGQLGITVVSSGPAAGGPWRALALSDRDGWRARISYGQGLPEFVPSNQSNGTSVTFSQDGSLGGIFGSDQTPAASLAFHPEDLLGLGEELPVIVNRAFLEENSLDVGDNVSAEIAGEFRVLAIEGVVDSFPTTDPERPLLIIDGPTLGLVRLDGTGTVRDPDEWWMSIAPGADEAIVASLRAAPFQSTEVVSLVERTRSLSTDPVALGIIGALTLGFVVTGLFAVVGLIVSGAVSARQRRTEFALLRALGLSGRQLFGSLWLENGSVVLVSLLAGTTLGLVIGWTVLPFITVTQQAGAPIPPVLVEVPWDRILLLEVISAIALAVAVVIIGGVLRRLGVGSILRMGED